ncbi:butyrate kinase [Budvicia aquatica]|nr:butyrate kinase [Budvicia aquatica]
MGSVRYTEKSGTGISYKHNIDIKSLDAIVSRGPAVKPLHSGVYKINQQMLDDAKSRRYGDHPCAIGCMIAYDLALNTVPAYTVDPPCVDEMISVARVTGLPAIQRKSFFQALNHKAVGRLLAKQLNRRYEDLNIVISHLGSGISVASHLKGRVIDVTNGLDGDAPFGLDRVGTLPVADWMRFCLSGDNQPEDLHRILNGGGGMMAHLGTSSAIDIEQRIQQGDKHAELIYDAMAFQIVKGIGAAACALGTRPDAIVFTGGLANSTYFTNKLKTKLDWLAPVHIFAGEK